MTREADNAPGLPSWRHLALVALLCAVVYWPFLGATGFTQTEGHRVVPAWEMLDTGDYLITRMFDQVYLRKPPGMPWAIALSSSIFGQTEFAVRAVSAMSMTLLSLLSAFFAARWFGRRLAIYAGAAAALTPLFWATGRAAEIEALNNLATAAAIFLLIDLAIVRRDQLFHRQIGLILAAAAALILAALAKGPAGFAAIGAVVPAACIASRSLRPLARPALWVAAIVAALALAALYIMIQRAVEQTGQTPVVQGVSDFLWTAHGLSLQSVPKVLAMPPSALLSALPASFALLFVWSPASPNESEHARRARLIARTLALTGLLSLVLLTILGVHNPRYAMPSLVMLPILVAYVFSGWPAAPRRVSNVLTPALARALLIILILAAVASTAWEQHRRTITSGREPGIALAAHLPDQATIYADLLIEARPEVLLYARRAAAAENRRIHIRWIPGLAGPDFSPPAGTYLALRIDERANETAALAHLSDRLEAITTGRVHNFKFLLVRVKAAE